MDVGVEGGCFATAKLGPGPVGARPPATVSHQGLKMVVEFAVPTCALLPGVQ